jgi:hypothetical protein
MKKTITVLLVLILVIALAACSGNNAITVASTQAVQSFSSSTSVNVTSTVVAANSAEVALSENSKTHDNPQDYVLDSSNEIPIVFNGSAITAGDGVTIEGSKATITAAGTYILSGSLTDGQLIVNTNKESTVRLVLNGVDIHSTTSAPIYILQAKETIIDLADNTENALSDGTSYVFATSDVTEPNAAIYSKADLTIFGNGSLTVAGNYQDGITSTDGLIISSGTIKVNAADDGIRGKDYLVVKSGNITINAQGTGIKSDNAVDATKGYISIEGGDIQVTSSGDAIEAATDVMITNGNITVTSGGGSNNQGDNSTSTKGIKGVIRVNIDGGNFTIDSADDAIHSNGSIVINNGTFQLATGDDGIHADATLEINGGTIGITNSYEGIESAVITINAGDIHLVSSDDGINGAGGNDGSGINQQQGGARQDKFASSSNVFLHIHGGYIFVDANGDGIDINGAVEMTDGVLIVNGPTANMNGALDYDNGFSMTGGFLLAAGSSGMAMAPDSSSSQAAVLIYFSSTLPANTLVHIQDSTGKDVLTFTPTKPIQSIAISSPDLVKGTTYTIYTGGGSTGTVTDGVYKDGTYTPGTQLLSFTVSGIVTTAGNPGAGGKNRPRP